jgi:hypothetical protein
MTLMVSRLVASYVRIVIRRVAAAGMETGRGNLRIWRKLAKVILKPNPRRNRHNYPNLFN